MRVLWMSNAPHCNSGYGVVTSEVCKRIAKGSTFPTKWDKPVDLAIFAYWGLKGGMNNWNGILVYPNDPEDYGNKLAEMYYKEFNADVLISLMDVWVLDQKVFRRFNWVPYFPIDHMEVPPIVMSHLTSRVYAITMSKFGHKKALEKGIDNTYVPHGVDTKAYCPNHKYRRTLRDSIGIKDDDFVVGSVASNIGERKNWEAMIEVFAEFHKRHRNTRFLAYTQPRHKAGLRNIPEYVKSLGLDDCFHFPPTTMLFRGAVQPEMSALYNAMDVFLLLSKGEGFGIPILEAQACGVPVIVTDFTSMTELCASKWLVEVERLEWSYQSTRRAVADRQSALDRLEQAYWMWEEGHYQDKRAEARQFALQYDWDKIVPEYWIPCLSKIESIIKQPDDFEEIAKRRVRLGFEETAVYWNRMGVLRQLLMGRRRVLDVGCGHQEPIYVCNFEEAVAMDTSQVALDSLKKPSVEYLVPFRGQVVKGDIREIPFPDDEFEVAIASECIEHLPSLEDARRALAELIRVAPEVIVTVPYGYWEEKSHHIQFTPKILQSILPENVKSKLINFPYVDEAARTGNIVLRFRRAE